MFNGLAVVAGLTSVLLYQQHSNSELERRIALQGARIRELETKISTLRNYVPLFEAPKEQQQGSSTENCYFDIELGPCGEEVWNHVVESAEEVVKDLKVVKEDRKRVV